MRGDEVSDEVEAEAPPDGAKDIAGHLLHPPHEDDGMIDLGEELKQEGEQEDGHGGLHLSLSDKLWHNQPHHNLQTKQNERHRSTEGSRPIHRRARR